MATTTDQGSAMALSMVATEETSTAVSQVIHTTELLENVLLFLDLRTLLFAKRVCTQFKDVIDGSTNIQKALFFEPLSSRTAVDVEILQTNPPESNCSNCGGVHPYLPTHVPKVIPANPLLDRYLSYCFSPAFRGCYSRGIYVRFSKDLQDQIRLADPSSSWRRMFAIQPHAAPFYVSDRAIGGEPCVLTSGYQGLRMEDLVVSQLRGIRITPGQNGDFYINRFPASIQLYYGMTWALGKYEESTVPRLHRAEVVDGICGWDALSPGLGPGLEVHTAIDECE